ncbi:MAG: helix-turn-helix domain-containing protein [Candidatus Levybacteria bacterium]|nr:helix-turn-helix domain-containing protein [Candidatus Levybacteria bacterium]
MEVTVLEAQYPLTFHKHEAEILGEHLKNRHNIVLIGMKRVGISNFLRFFLYHKDIASTYIGDGKKHVFIPVDLNDLVEREIFPFWTLTLKRIVDAVSIFSDDPKLKKEIEMLFLDSIQSQDLFLTIDSVRKSLLMLVERQFIPTIFFVQFDRMGTVSTQEFLANLQGLKEATNFQLSYVFTSFRPLGMLAPYVFTKASLVVFVHDMYLPPVNKEDVKIIYETYRDRYSLKLTQAVENALFELVDGYVRYLHLALIILNEKKKQKITTKQELSEMLLKDERIYLQSEELWESLMVDEQDVLKKVVKHVTLSAGERALGKYLWETGMISEDGKGNASVFSPLFLTYLKQKEKKTLEAQGTEFTKKEQALFEMLKKNAEVICEREKIIEAVWPEVEELGVTDWAIDRLVARVRGKLRLQKSNFEIQTIKTRGYKLISVS